MLCECGLIRDREKFALFCGNRQDFLKLALELLFG
jgi:hypothetical protein